MKHKFFAVLLALALAATMALPTLAAQDADTAAEGAVQPRAAYCENCGEYQLRIETFNEYDHSIDTPCSHFPSGRDFTVIHYIEKRYYCSVCGFRSSSWKEETRRTFQCFGNKTT